MLATQVPTLIVLVASPISWAVASTSLLTSALKIASKPHPSASRATARISDARQPTPGMMPRAKRSAIGFLLRKHYRSRHYVNVARDEVRRVPHDGCPVSG